MRFLIVAQSFAGPNVQPWLVDDLANSLVDKGHSVDVIVAQAKNPRPKGEMLGTRPGLRVFSVGVESLRSSSFEKLLGHLNAGFGLHTSGFRWAKENSYDSCIFFSIGSFTWGFPKRIRACGIAKKLVFFLWDFFPIHQLEIGRIRRNRLEWLMKKAEFWSFQNADVVALMSPANIRFFHNYFPKAGNRTIEVPPWASAKAEPEVVKSNKSLKALFGGQLAKGRGLDTLLATAEILLEQTDIEIIIAGDGPERSRLEVVASDRKLSNVKFLGSLPREEYRQVALNCDLGIAITVEGVSPPTFPSKIIEYCRLHLPVIVCTEKSSDAGKVIAENGAGLWINAGEPEKLADSLIILRNEQKLGTLEQMAKNASQLFEEKFSVLRVVEALERL